MLLSSIEQVKGNNNIISNIKCILMEINSKSEEMSPKIQ